MNTSIFTGLKSHVVPFFTLLAGVSLGFLVGVQAGEDFHENTKAGGEVPELAAQGSAVVQDGIPVNTMIGYYTKWVDASPQYCTRGMNIPASVVEEMYSYLQGNPTDPGGAPRAGIRVYYGSVQPINTAEPEAAETRMIVWPLNGQGQLDKRLNPELLPVLRMDAGFELPCPRYCDTDS